MPKISTPKLSTPPRAAPAAIASTSLASVQLSAQPSAAGSSIRTLFLALALLGALLLALASMPPRLVPGELRLSFGRVRSPILAAGLSLLGSEAVLLLLFHKLVT